jgi:hypothetical protein
MRPIILAFTFLLIQGVYVNAKPISKNSASSITRQLTGNNQGENKGEFWFGTDGESV